MSFRTFVNLRACSHLAGEMRCRHNGDGCKARGEANNDVYSRASQRRRRAIVPQPFGKWLASRKVASVVAYLEQPNCVSPSLPCSSPAFFASVV